MIYRELVPTVREIMPLRRTSAICMRFEGVLNAEKRRIVKARSHESVKEAHYFSDDYMGTEFVTELVETLYEMTALSIPHVDDLKECLQKDSFGTNVMPSQHVRSVTIQLSLHTLHAKRACTQPRQNEAHVERREYVRAVGKLQVLKALAYKSACIDICEIGRAHV